MTIQVYDFGPHPYGLGEVLSVRPSQVGFLVTGDRCDRCGDVNFDEARVCLTCTYPDAPCSAVGAEAA